MTKKVTTQDVLEHMTKAQLIKLIQEERNRHHESLSRWRKEADTKARENIERHEEANKLKKLLRIMRDLIDMELGGKLGSWTLALAGGAAIMSAWALGTSIV
jgi:hypothetical protein